MESEIERTEKIENLLDRLESPYIVRLKGESISELRNEIIELINLDDNRVITVSFSQSTKFFKMIGFNISPTLSINSDGDLSGLGTLFGRKIYLENGNQK